MTVRLMDVLTRQIVDGKITVEDARRIVLNRAHAQRKERSAKLIAIDRERDEPFVEQINGQKKGAA